MRASDRLANARALLDRGLIDQAEVDAVQARILGAL